MDVTAVLLFKTFWIQDGIVINFNMEMLRIHITASASSVLQMNVRTACILSVWTHRCSSWCILHLSFSILWCNKITPFSSVCYEGSQSVSVVFHLVIVAFVISSCHDVHIWNCIYSGFILESLMKRLKFSMLDFHLLL